MAAIEAGAEDVESSEDGHLIYCADTDLHEVSNALETDLGESQSTKLIWKPTTTTELDVDGLRSLMKLVDALEDDDDVQRVTTNFEANDEVMAALYLDGGYTVPAIFDSVDNVQKFRVSAQISLKMIILRWKKILKYYLWLNFPLPKQYQLNI